MFHAKTQSNIPSGPGEVDIVVFAIFSKGGHIRYSIFDLTEIHALVFFSLDVSPANNSDTDFIVAGRFRLLWERGIKFS